MIQRPLHTLDTPYGPVFEVMDLISALDSFTAYEAVISLMDPGRVVDFPPHPCHRVFVIRDVLTAMGASPKMLQELLELDLAKTRRVLVHCEVGVSRSPAVAMLLAVRWGADDAAILKGINWHQARPNRRILELGEGLLAMPGRLTTLAVQGPLGASSATLQPIGSGSECLEGPARHRIILPGGRRLEVRGLPEAQAIYRDFDAVISLQDPWAEVTWNEHPAHWIFRVRDIEGDAEHAPSLDLVRKILDLDLGGARRILVHCHEGFSRSTAAAILLATKLGASLEAILAGIDWTHAYPNRRILDYGEEILGTGGALSGLVDEGLSLGGWR